MLADEDVFEGAHFGKKPDVLVSARYSKAGDLVGAQALDGCAFEDNFTLVTFAKTRNAVEESGFPRAVRADHADYGFFRDIKIHTVDGHEAAEAFVHFSCSQDSCHGDLAIPLRPPRLRHDAVRGGEPGEA